MMTHFPIYIWLTGGLIFLIFILWYHNWQGALKPHEIGAYMDRLVARPNLDERTRDALYNFMRDDTGHEFIMVNLVKLHTEPIKHPKTGEEARATAVVQEYFQPFMRQILKRAGHPAFLGQVRGDYVEEWQVEDNPGWQSVGLIRYRSRRDLMEAALNPQFDSIHIFKQIAVANTLALPVERTMSFMLSPRIWLGLVLFSLCSFVHLIYLIRTSP